MAWVYAKRYIRSGTVVDWREPMANINAIAKEWNGLWDRDNIPPAFVTRAKVAPNAFNDLGILKMTVAQDVPAGTISGWFDVDELSEMLDVRDGSIVVDGWVQFDSTVAALSYVGEIATDFVEARLLVGNAVVAESGWCSCARRKTAISLQGYSPTGSGTVRVKVQVRVYRFDLHFEDDLEAGIGLATFTNSSYETMPTRADISIRGGALVYRHTKR